MELSNIFPTEDDCFQDIGEIEIDSTDENRFFSGRGAFCDAGNYYTLSRVDISRAGSLVEDTEGFFTLEDAEMNVWECPSGEYDVTGVVKVTVLETEADSFDMVGDLYCGTVTGDIEGGYNTDDGCPEWVDVDDNTGVTQAVCVLLVSLCLVFGVIL